MYPYNYCLDVVVVVVCRGANTVWAVRHLYCTDPSVEWQKGGGTVGKRGCCGYGPAKLSPVELT